MKKKHYLLDELPMWDIDGVSLDTLLERLSSLKEKYGHEYENIFFDLSFEHPFKGEEYQVFKIVGVRT